MAGIPGGAEEIYCSMTDENSPSRTSVAIEFRPWNKKVHLTVAILAMGKSVHVPSERKLSKKFPMPDPIEQEKVIAEDVETLHRMGYAQELLRRMSGFSNFAISLSIICILAGGITTFHLGLCGVGGAAVGLGWPLVCLYSLAVAATMGQVASAFPTAGGLYHWASLL